MKAKIRRQSAHRTRRIQHRLDKTNAPARPRPVFTASDIRFTTALM